MTAGRCQAAGHGWTVCVTEDYPFRSECPKVSAPVPGMGRCRAARAPLQTNATADCMSIPEVVIQVRVRGRHPWFYRKMIRKPERALPAGGLVRAVDRDGRVIGTGFYNPRSELALRIFSPGIVEDAAAHFVRALTAAFHLREQVLGLPDVTNAYRVVHAEGDGFPGLVLDRLGDAYVAQLSTLGMQKVLEPLGEWILQHHRGARLLLQQDEDAAKREGMERVPRPSPVAVEVTEHGLRYAVQAGGGHKTGFFADQRDNRMYVRSLARGRSVLDLCCNAGGFAMNALVGKARSVLAADLDEAAVDQTRANLARNKLRADVVHADAFDLLRELEPGSRDLIVLDPPKWVRSKDELEQGLARYRDLNRLAIEKLPPGGLLVTCSCSGTVSEESFLRTVADAATQARRDLRVLAHRGAGPDHPFALECPETRYLKVIVLQVRG